MTGIRFESAAALLWVWLVPLIFVLGYYMSKLAKKKMDKKLNPKLQSFLFASLNLKRRKWKRILEGGCLVLMIVAYARPQTVDGEQTVKNEGIEIVLLFDISNSMLAQDIKPSRLDFAKKEVSRFINMSSGDRMAVVAFAGSAMLLTPMTTDKEALKMYVESLTTDSVSTQGTVFQKALQEASEAFKRGGLSEQEGSHVTRAIVIVSDGEDHEQGAYDEATKLTAEGVRIFTLAFGSEAGAPIPIFGSRGEAVGFRRDKNSQPIMSKTDGKVLKELARIGEGAFYHASLQGDIMGQLRADLEKLKKAEFESGTMRSYGEEYQPILFLAILLGLIELIMGERIKSFRIWRGRFEVGVQ